jgi:hypothetical protein
MPENFTHQWKARPDFDGNSGGGGKKFRGGAAV